MQQSRSKPLCIQTKKTALGTLGPQRSVRASAAQTLQQMLAYLGRQPFAEHYGQ